MTIKRAWNSEWQRQWENSTSKLHYIKSCIEEWESNHNSSWQYEVPLSRLYWPHLTHGHLMSRKDQQPTCTISAGGNQTLTITHFLGECPNWGTVEKIQYSEQYKNATRKRLRSGKDNKVSYADKYVWRNIKIMDSWWDQYDFSSALYSHKWLWRG